jgi:hypothetical protein
LNQPVPADHRRGHHSAASPDAAQAPDVVGPDGIRVTLRIEPAVDRLLRWRRLWSTPEPLTSPGSTYVDYRVLPGFVQRLLGGSWVVDVEADSGDRVRVTASTREEAVGYARQIRDGIEAQGVAFLRTFAG